MNYQDLTLFIKAFTDEAVYSWLLSFIGSILITLRSDNELENQTPKQTDSLNMFISIIGGAIFSRFVVSPLTLIWESLISAKPLLYFLVALIGYKLSMNVVVFFTKLGNKISSDETVNTVYDLIKSFLTRKKQ